MWHSKMLLCYAHYKVINVFILHLSRLFCRDSAFIGTVCPGVQESEGGLYVCMNTFLGFGREHVERHYRKTGQCVYMHLKRHVKEVRYTCDLYFCWLLVLNGTVFIVMILWCVILFSFILSEDVLSEHSQVKIYIKE